MFNFACTDWIHKTLYFWTINTDSFIRNSVGIPQRWEILFYLNLFHKVVYNLVYKVNEATNDAICATSTFEQERKTLLFFFTFLFSTFESIAICMTHIRMLESVGLRKVPVYIAIKEISFLILFELVYFFVQE